MQLDERLSAVAKFVRQGAKLIDIGTDHAKLPIYLTETGKISFAIASDKNEGPLFFARENINRAGLGDKISVRLGDGLLSVQAGEVDTIVVAGMGGALIKEILSLSPLVLKSVESLILQPMNEGNALRKWLYENDFYIEDETLAKEDGRIYEIISAKHGQRDMPSKFELLFGPVIFKSKTEMLKERILEFAEKERKKLRGMEKSEKVKTTVEYTLTQNKLKGLEELLW
ncbi:MAG: SAM-dependent methyltransferase [Selenomonadaceae bacterium]|nr:SAM-dependent methyltransferase [Selenomonadaceae bacterium]